LNFAESVAAGQGQSFDDKNPDAAAYRGEPCFVIIVTLLLATNQAARCLLTNESYQALGYSPLEFSRLKQFGQSRTTQLCP
jgi:hypothetical protein